MPRKSILNNKLKIAIESLPAQLENLKANSFNTFQTGRKNKVDADNMSNTGTSGSNPFSQWYRDLFGAQQIMTDEYHKYINDKGKGKPVKPGIINDSQEHLKNKNDGKKPKYF